MTDVKEEPEKITDDGAEKDKKIAAHQRNDTDQEKEEMKRKIGALQQLVNFKDSIIRKQKTIIKRNRVTHPGSINHFGAAEEAEGMKLKIALLEKLLEEEHLKNRTLNGIIQEMWDRETGKCDLLRKIQKMREEIRTLKERRAPPIESDIEDNKQNGRNEHTGKRRTRLPTIPEEPW